MDSWLQWSSLLAPHPNPRHFRGKKAKRFYRLTAPTSTMSSLSTDTQGKRKIKKLRRSFSPPPKIQSFCFESEPIMDVTSPNPLLCSVTDQANRGAYVNRYPKTEDPVSFTKGHCNARPPSAPRSQLNIGSTSLGTVPAASTNHSIGSLALNSMSTATNALPEPTPYSFVLSSSLIRRVSRTLKKKCSPQRSLIPKFKLPSESPLEPSSALDTATPTTLLPAVMSSSSSCQTQPRLQLPPLLKPPIPLSDTNPAQAVPSQHAPQGTFEYYDTQTELEGTRATTFPSAISLCVGVRHSKITTKSSGAPETVPSQEAIRLDDTVQRGEPKLATGSAVLTEDPESEAIWALPEERERAFPSKHLRPPSLSDSSPLSPLSMEGSDFEVAMKSRRWFYKKRDCEYNVITTGDDVDPDATVSSGQGGGAVFGTQPSMSVNVEDIDSLIPFPSAQLPSQSQASQRSNFAATRRPPITASSTNVAIGCEENSTPHSGISLEQISPGSGHASPTSTIGIGDGGVVERTLARGGTLMGSSLKSTLAKWKWKRGRGISDSEGDNRVRNSAESTPEVVGFSSAVAGGASSGGLKGHADIETANSEPLHITVSATVAVKAVDIPQDLASEGAPSEPPQGNAAKTMDTRLDSTPRNMNIFDTRQVNKVERDVHPKTKAKFTIGGDVDESVVEFPGDDLDKDDDFGTLAQDSRPVQVLADPIVSELTPRGKRRWTLANALKDEAISDAGLVRELERMREEREEECDVERVVLEGWGDVYANIEGIESGEEQEKNTQDRSDAERMIAMSTSSSEEGSGTLGAQKSISRINPDSTLHSRSVSIPSHSWLTAQRALLTCRELILTERHYLGLLSTLVNQETVTPPPPLMRHYAAELLRASQSVLNGMENEPTTMGIAKAFLDKEEEIEGSYVKWCEVVGDWFSGDSYGLDGGTGSGSGGRTSIDGAENWGRRLSLRRKNRVGRLDGDTNGNVTPILDSEGDEVGLSPLKRTVSTWRKSMPTLGFDAVSIYGGSVWRKEKEKEDEKSEDIAVKKPTVRELAILPTQRVMRYDLLYQDLLSLTPSTSVSRALVEQAARAATRIAQNCDRAQGNVAFSRSSPSSKHNAHSRSSSRRGSRRPSLAVTSVPPVPPLNEAVAKQAGTIIDSDMTAFSAPPTKTTFAPQMLPPLANKGNGNSHSRPRRLSMSLGLVNPL